jgi:hypothetical protein
LIGLQLKCEETRLKQELTQLKSEFVELKASVGLLGNDKLLAD